MYETDLRDGRLRRTSHLPIPFFKMATHLKKARQSTLQTAEMKKNHRQRTDRKNEQNIHSRFIQVIKAAYRPKRKFRAATTARNQPIAEMPLKLSFAELRTKIVPSGLGL